MNYQPGQRVKRIRPFEPGDTWAPVGTEGTVIDDDGGEYVTVKWDRLTSEIGGACRHLIAPLTDPGAEQFIARVKSWKPEPVIPLPVKTYADLLDAVERDMRRARQV